MTTRLRDAAGREEQVFVAVDSLPADRVRGRIWNQIAVVEGYQWRQTVEFPEAAVVDWLITRPDGSEEGNVLGKYIDEWRASGSPPDHLCR